MSENRVEQVELLSSDNDSYGGVVVKIEQPIDSKIFPSLLRASISQWRQQGKKGVWIKLPIEHANLVEATVKEGFRYHHAEPDYLMLVCWLPETADTIPLNASHRVGVGSFVMNSKREVLVVQEISGKFKGTGVWKFPTGVVNEGEDFCTAAIREVKEETGIDTEFGEVLAFRQSHKSFFSKSDLLFICMLKPRNFDIEKQNLEIEAAKWMPIEDYAAQPFNQKQELFNYVAKICLSKSEKNYTGFSPLATTTGSGKWMPVEDYAAQPFNQKQKLFNYVAKICLSKSEKNYAGFSPLATTTGSGKTSYSTSIIKEGFRYHHAEPDYLMLVCWLPETTDTIPRNASHRVGVGSFVMNNKREVLVVQEISGKFKGTGVWKFPTGVVNEGEDICTAAIREVKEETGIDTEFVEVLAFRQSHKSFFSKSDLLFICMLKPRNFDIEKQNLEIDAAKWMPIEDYAAQPFNQKQELFNYVAKICLSKSEKNYTGFSPLATTTGSGKVSYLYFNNQDNNHLVTSDNQPLKV